MFDFVVMAVSLVALVIATASYVGYRQMWEQQDIARFVDSMKRVERILDRMELATFVVAKDLVTANGVVAGVAIDLAESKQRADRVSGGEAGAAADAGAQSGISLL